jgi:hypothetical protein
LYDVQVGPVLAFLDEAKHQSSTRFPIKAMPMLKALAAGVEPIPIPNTIPPPPLAKKSGGPGEGGEQPGKKRKSDVIVID